MHEDAVSDRAVRKIDNIVRDGQLAVLVGLIPILGLVYILRLVQWYLFKQQYPSLVAPDGPRPELARAFRGALPRLWFAVLFWPCLVVAVVAYGAVG